MALLETTNAVKNVQWIKFASLLLGLKFSFAMLLSHQLFCKVISLFLDISLNATNTDFHFKATIKHQRLLVLHRLYVLQTLYFSEKLNKDIFYVGV